ncbi:transcription factor iwr1 domain-containing protein [Ditylenchus destructor]|uniref:Probable RNA polymerase II nuclear localization protein SLC7A6OS n=1 Tax=Ditylenchus destructor TaxID=166010 RepID=A0AAD4R2W8_9BILA|nr:transcription factor iwr1 domain-containing protein [Ditylenchus destructor]
MSAGDVPSTSDAIPDPLLEPSSTIVRIRRKRNADPVAGLVVCPKIAKVNGELVEKLLCEEPKKLDVVNSEIIFRLVGTSDTPHARSAAPFLEKEHKVVEMVDFDPKAKLLGKRQVSVLDHGYLEVMKAAKAISDFGLDEQEKREFEKACTAPLAQGEAVETMIEEAGDSADYVYDFYYSTSGKRMIASPDTFEVRLPNDEELQLFYGGDEDEDDEGVDNEHDSNDENYYKNDYPDEDEFKNESTTDDDDYDHYGDEGNIYERYCKDESDDD